MREIAVKFKVKYINGGSVLIWMGALWLYLWLFPWYESYVNNPDWGHNYSEAGAFLILGIAYYNRRIVSDILAFISTLLIIPASLELIPHFITAITSGILLVLVIADVVIERKRDQDLFIPSDRQKAFWLKKHIPRFSYIMLAHIALIYFLVRLPLGTYETELVTKVFDGMLFPLMLLLTLEDMPNFFKSDRTKYTGFFWGMLVVIVSLAILAVQPETIPLLILSLVLTAVSVLFFFAGGKSSE